MNPLLKSIRNLIQTILRVETKLLASNPSSYYISLLENYRSNAEKQLSLAVNLEKDFLSGNRVKAHQKIKVIRALADMIQTDSKLFQLQLSNPNHPALNEMWLCHQ